MANEPTLTDDEAEILRQYRAHRAEAEKAVAKAEPVAAPPAEVVDKDPMGDFVDAAQNAVASFGKVLESEAKNHASVRQRFRKIEKDVGGAAGLVFDLLTDPKKADEFVASAQESLERLRGK